MDYGPPSSRVYVGNLPEDIRAEEIGRIFDKHGRINDITVKLPRTRGPAFAFIEYSDPGSARAALVEDQMRFDRAPMRVELAHASGATRRDAPGRGGPPGAGGPPQRSGFRVRVAGLPPSASWQDLKDHMRKAGDVGFTDVDRRGGGVVEYATAEGMDRALRELHQSDFSNRFGEGSRISVEEERGGGGGGPPPRGPPPSRGPSYDDRPPMPRDAPYDSRGPRDAPYDSRGPRDAPYDSRGPPGPRDSRDAPYDAPAGGADHGAPVRDEDRAMAAAPAAEASAAAAGAADSMPEAPPAAHADEAGEAPVDQAQDGADNVERDE